MSKCLWVATLRIDDRVSDARTIAGAAEQQCKIEADRFYQLQVQGQPDLQVQMLSDSGAGDARPDGGRSRSSHPAKE